MVPCWVVASSGAFSVGGDVRRGVLFTTPQEVEVLWISWGHARAAFVDAIPGVLSRWPLHPLRPRVSCRPVPSHTSTPYPVLLQPVRSGQGSATKKCVRMALVAAPHVKNVTYIKVSAALLVCHLALMTSCAPQGSSQPGCSGGRGAPMSDGWCWCDEVLVSARYPAEEASMDTSVATGAPACL